METSEFSKELIRLGERIKQIRKHRKLKLLQLEVLSGVNDSDISRYERGKENIEFITIYKLAKALEIEIKDLIDYEGPLPDNLKFKGFGKINDDYKKKKRKFPK